MTRVSQATRPMGSSRRTASRTASEIWSAILSGCPSVTDSDVKKCLPSGAWIDSFDWGWGLEPRTAKPSTSRPRRQRIPRKRNTLRPYARRSRQREAGQIGDPESPASCWRTRTPPPARSPPPRELRGHSPRTRRAGRRTRRRTARASASSSPKRPRRHRSASTRTSARARAPGARALARAARLLLDQRPRCCAAGHGLDSDRPAARVEVEHAGAGDRGCRGCRRAPRARGRTSGARSQARQAPCPSSVGSSRTRRPRAAASRRRLGRRELKPQLLDLDPLGVRLADAHDLDEAGLRGELQHAEDGAVEAASAASPASEHRRV